jgi:hypothetical protein
MYVWAKSFFSAGISVAHMYKKIPADINQYF